ncbi:MAG: hypothetical protein H7222_08375 [Methylotenera sp.]|nr:hypothetical protein [Oligoflexia bacterium]
MKASPAHRPPALPPEALEFIDSVGDFIQYWGFRKIQGRLWAFLHLSPEALSAVEISRTLGVSKSLVSLALPELLTRGVIREVSRGHGRTIYYETSPDLMKVITGVLRGRERKLLERSSAAITKLVALSEKKPTPSINLTKAHEVSQFISGAQAILEGLIGP